MTAYRTDKVDTPAGVYTVELHTDEDPENPLTSWDHEGMAFYTHGDRLITNDTLDDAGHAGDVLRQLINEHAQRGLGDYSRKAVQRRFDKWRAIAGSPWVLVMGTDSSSQSDYYSWYVLVDAGLTYVASDGNSYPALPDPVSAAKATMQDYRTWAAGEVSGFVTKTPDGEVVESVWGFYDDDDAISEGKLYAESDALDRVDTGNRVGAGFIGII